MAMKTQNDSSLHIAIVDTGSGAFATAIKAADEGATVTIIEGGKDVNQLSCCAG